MLTKIALAGRLLAVSTVVVTATIESRVFAEPARIAPKPSAQEPENRNDRTASSREPDLRVDVPALSKRARELILIGENGIATENPAALEAFFHPAFRFHATDGTTLNREQLWASFAGYRAAFDDFKVTRQHIFSDGGAYVAARTTFSGIFARPLTLPPIGRIEPHGKPVSWTINNIFRYAPDGRLIEEWVQYDSRLVFERLGIELMVKR